MTADCDLAVIGGGPAGATAAQQAATRHLQTVLLERGTFPRDRVCGEFISAEAIPLLASIAGDALADAAPIQCASFIGAGQRVRSFRLPQAAIGFSRLRLDAMLFDRAQAGGAEVLARSAVVDVVPGNPFVIRYTNSDGNERSLTARALIVAAGRWWTLPSLRPSYIAQVEARKSPWVGVKARFTNIRQLPAVEMYHFRGGYCGLAPVESGLVNACCLLHRSRAGDLSRSRDFLPWIIAASGHSGLRDRLRGAEQATATVCTAPIRLARRASTAGAALLAGDAAGFLDPFAGDGLASAMLSGALAAHTICDTFARGADAASAAAAYDNRLRSAIGQSYRSAGWLRALVHAPAPLQSAAATLLLRPALAQYLVHATRWRTPA